MKRCATLLIAEMQTKTTVRYHLILVIMAIIKKPQQEILKREWRKENNLTLLVETDSLIKGKNSMRLF